MKKVLRELELFDFEPCTQTNLNFLIKISTKNKLFF